MVSALWLRRGHHLQAEAFCQKQEAKVVLSWMENYFHSPFLSVPPHLFLYQHMSKSELDVQKVKLNAQPSQEHINTLTVVMKWREERMLR